MEEEHDQDLHELLHVPDVVSDHLRIRDQQHYLESRGLRNEPEGIESILNVSEKRQRVLDADAHQEHVFRSVFGDAEEEGKEKAAFLETLEESMITFKAADGKVETDVKPMVAQCDAIYALASTRDKFCKTAGLELSLIMYQQASVQEFVDIASGAKSINEVSPNLVIECCQIAHYLQCETVLTPIVQILVDAVDTDNCRSLLELADRLDLPALFERALSHMMGSLSGTEDVWDDLSDELRCRVTLLKKAMESSVIAGTSRLYFTSVVEYLAMFAETVEYHRERLHNAKERQEEVLDDHLVRSRGWEYNQQKIELQEKRVRRLELVMKEQKRTFTQADASSVMKVGKQQAA